jgi:16S rRNA (cytosine1402-N4)-methyltransferase
MDRPLPLHVPVMLDEVLQGLDPQPGQTFVDGTLGGGGHTEAIARRVGEKGLVVSLDRDPQALTGAEARLAGLPVMLVGASYCELPEVLAQLEIPAVQGIVLDLGLSSDQLADAERGFSFDSAGPLDLRFDPSTGEPAWQLIGQLEEGRLADLIYRYGEERHSRRIARNIVQRRATDPIRTAAQLAEVVRRSVPRLRVKPRIDPATRTFQALRSAVNDELGALERGLACFPDLLVEGGRVVVISFHSLEDRPVKQAFRDDPRYEPVTRKPLRPSAAELEKNPRARSAKLRIAAKR